MKYGILAASFGTGVEETRERTIGAIEGEAAQRWPGLPVRRAFTSGMIRKKLAGEGIRVDDVSSALRAMGEEGVARLAVLPTFVMGGFEYHRLLEDCRRAAGSFEALEIARPLLGCPGDLLAAARAVLDGHPAPPEDAVLALMGHGTGHAGDFAYGALDCAFRDLGRRNVFVATVEGSQGLGSLRRRLREYGPRRVVLRPFMITAGEHVQSDMAGEGPGSWKNILAADGYEVECVPQGLGELPGIRRLLLEHLEEAMTKLGKEARPWD